MSDKHLLIDVAKTVIKRVFVFCKELIHAVLLLLGFMAAVIIGLSVWHYQKNSQKCIDMGLSGEELAACQNDWD